MANIFHKASSSGLSSTPVTGACNGVVEWRMNDEGIVVMALLVYGTPPPLMSGERSFAIFMHSLFRSHSYNSHRSPLHCLSVFKRLAEKRDFDAHKLLMYDFGEILPIPFQWPEPWCKIP